MQTAIFFDFLHNKGRLCFKNAFFCGLATVGSHIPLVSRSFLCYYTRVGRGIAFTYVHFRTFTLMLARKSTFYFTFALARWR